MLYDLDELERLEQAATPEWCVDWSGRKIYRKHTWDHAATQFDKPDLNIFKLPMRTDKYPITHEEWTANAELAVLMRNALPHLIREIKELRFRMESLDK